MSATIETPSYVGVTCKCGHFGDYEEFTRTDISGDLPRGHFQCPKCKEAWKLERKPASVGWSGCPLPGPTVVTPVSPVL